LLPFNAKTGHRSVHSDKRSLIPEHDLIHLVFTRYRNAAKTFLFILVAVHHVYSLLAH